MGDGGHQPGQVVPVALIELPSGDADNSENGNNDERLEPARALHDVFPPVWASVRRFRARIYRPRATSEWINSASSSGLSSCRKCPAFRMMLWGCPFAPGMRACRMRS